MNRTRVKICGITSPEDALLAVESGCDAIGLNFYPKSPRHISLEQAKAICDVVPAFVSIVALFVDPDPELVNRAIKALRLESLQFHGEESEQFCQQFNKPYIKAIPVKQEDTNDTLIASIASYPSAASILVDSFDPVSIGGSGKVFDWELLPREYFNKLILAGGLSETNVAKAVALLNPYAVDVSSGVEQVNPETGEVRKGRKDAARMDAFIKEVMKSDLKRFT